MTPQIITTLVIIVAMFALMLLNKFPLAVTMTLTGATSPSAISLDCLDRLEQDQHRIHAVPVSLPA